MRFWNFVILQFFYRVVAFHIYVLKSVPSAIRTRKGALMADQDFFVAFRLLFLHVLWCYLCPYSLSNIKYRDIILSDNSFPSAHLSARHEKKKGFLDVTLVPNQKITLSEPLLTVMTKMIMLMKYIQMKFVGPGSWQSGIGASATVSALKRNDTKIRITISPVKTKHIINCCVLTGSIVITTAKVHKGNEFD